MKRINRRGFTLIEMLLAIGIALIISGLFFSLVIAIKSSYYRAYNDDDCSDIAALYAEALENTVIYDVQNGISDTISINSDSILTNTNHTITFTEIDNFNRATTNQKWDIRMVCDFDSMTGEFRYKFYFIDLYVAPGYLHYVYEGSFWLPSYSGYTVHNIGDGDVWVPSAAPSGVTAAPTTPVTGTPAPTLVPSLDWDYNVTAPSPYNITIGGNAGVVRSDVFEGADMTPQEFYTRINSNQTADSSSTRVAVPDGSSIVNINGGGGGGA